MHPPLAILLYHTKVCLQPGHYSGESGLDECSFLNVLSITKYLSSECCEYALVNEMMYFMV